MTWVISQEKGGGDHERVVIQEKGGGGDHDVGHTPGVGYRVQGPEP